MKIRKHAWIVLRHGAWHLRWKPPDGKERSQKLARFCDEYRTVKSVKPLADDILQSIQHTGTLSTIQRFVENDYLPYIEQHKKPSTVKGYRNMYKRYVAGPTAGIKLHSFRTRDGQLLMNEIARQNDLTHRTLTHIKHFLSGVFVHARRMGVYIESNPITDVEIPRGRRSEPTEFYTQQEVDAIERILTGTAKTAFILSAYTGLALGELRGLKWQDIDFEKRELVVNQTVWRKHIVEPKTETRQDAVPLIEIVHNTLIEHRRANPLTVWVFEGEKAFPLDLATLGSKRIKPILEQSGLKWKGWHGARRSFATRLYAKGVSDAVVQRLMRHSNFGVTRRNYIKTTAEDAINAIQVLNS